MDRRLVGGRPARCLLLYHLAGRAGPVGHRPPGPGGVAEDPGPAHGGRTTAYQEDPGFGKKYPKPAVILGRHPFGISIYVPGRISPVGKTV